MGTKRKKCDSKEFIHPENIASLARQQKKLLDFLLGRHLPSSSSSSNHNNNNSYHQQITVDLTVSDQQSTIITSSAQNSTPSSSALVKPSTTEQHSANIHRGHKNRKNKQTESINQQQQRQKKHPHIHHEQHHHDHDEEDDKSTLNSSIISNRSEFGQFNLTDIKTKCIRAAAASPPPTSTTDNMPAIHGSDSDGESEPSDGISLNADSDRSCDTFTDISQEESMITEHLNYYDEGPHVEIVECAGCNTEIPIETTATDR